jgi:hypothetical protein
MESLIYYLPGPAGHSHRAKQGVTALNGISQVDRKGDQPAAEGRTFRFDEFWHSRRST